MTEPEKYLEEIAKINDEYHPKNPWNKVVPLRNALGIIFDIKYEHSLVIREKQDNDFKIRKTFADVGLFGIDENCDPTNVMITWFRSNIDKLRKCNVEIDFLRKFREEVIIENETLAGDIDYFLEEQNNAHE